MLVTQYDVTPLIIFMPHNYGMLCTPKIVFPHYYTMTMLYCAFLTWYNWNSPIPKIILWAEERAWEQGDIAEKLFMCISLLSSLS